MTTRTITLTNRPPVRIDEDAWPVLAQSSYSDWVNQFKFQANRTWDGSIRVRQHADGRAIVYATCTHDSAFQGERGFSQRAGELLDKGSDAAAIIDAIHRVHGSIDGDEGGRATEWRLLAAECIANLPPEQL